MFGRGHKPSACWGDSAASTFLQAGAGDLQLLHGPPGTGKTTTLVALLQALHCEAGRKRGPRTLVCAPSNRGVAELLTRLLIRATPRLSSISVALVGDGEAPTPRRCKRALMRITDISSCRTAEARLFRAIEAMDEEAAAQAGVLEDELPPVPPGPVEARTVRDDCFVYSFAMQMHSRLGRLAMDAEQLSGDSDGATDANEVEGFAATLAATVSVSRRRVKRAVPALYRAELRAAFRSVSAAVLGLHQALGTAVPDDDPAPDDDSTEGGDSAADGSEQAHLLNVAVALKSLTADLAPFLPLGPRHHELVQEMLASADLVFCTLIVAGSHIVRTTRPAEILIVSLRPLLRFELGCSPMARQ